jgi:sugar lactone lactonase YvrE
MGITFLNGTLYVNNVIFNKLYRIPVDAAGKPGRPVDIWMDQPVKGPDGMRAANGKLYVAENGSGKISAITINGDKASVTVIKEGLTTPPESNLREIRSGSPNAEPARPCRSPCLNS